jgi:hypothetical protein
MPDGQRGASGGAGGGGGGAGMRGVAQAAARDDDPCAVSTEDEEEEEDEEDEEADEEQRVEMSLEERRWMSGTAGARSSNAPAVRTQGASPHGVLEVGFYAAR